MTEPNHERLPLLPDGQLTSAQREAVALIAAGPRGALIGPFVPLLRAPELMTRLQLVGEYLRFSSEIEEDLFELSVLVVARHWSQDFEWGFHYPIALEKGVPKIALEDVAARRRPTVGRPELALVFDMASSILQAGELDDELYARGIASLGEQAMVELVVTVGYYTTLALVMNVAKTPPPSGSPRLTRESSE